MQRLLATLPSSDARPDGSSPECCDIDGDCEDGDDDWCCGDDYLCSNDSSEWAASRGGKDVVAPRPRGTRSRTCGLRRYFDARRGVSTQSPTLPDGGRRRRVQSRRLLRERLLDGAQHAVGVHAQG